MDASSGLVRDDGRVARRTGSWYVALAVAVVLVAGGCSDASPDSPPSGIDELQIPTPSPDPDDFVRGIDNPWLALEPGAPGATRSAAPRPGTLVITVEDTTHDVAGVATTPVTPHRADRRPGRRLLRPGPARQRVVVRPGGRVAGRRGRRPGGPRHAGDAAAGRRLARGVRRGRGGRADDRRDPRPDRGHAGREVQPRASASTSPDPLEPDAARRTFYERGVGLVEEISTDRPRLRRRAAEPAELSH